jgi:hypothetical protein
MRPYIARNVPRRSCPWHYRGNEQASGLSDSSRLSDSDVHIIKVTEYTIFGRSADVSLKTDVSVYVVDFWPGNVIWFCTDDIRHQFSGSRLASRYHGKMAAW